MLRELFQLCAIIKAIVVPNVLLFLTLYNINDYTLPRDFPLINNPTFLYEELFGLRFCSDCWREMRTGGLNQDFQMRRVGGGSGIALVGTRHGVFPQQKNPVNPLILKILIQTNGATIHHQPIQLPSTSPLMMPMRSSSTS